MRVPSRGKWLKAPMKGLKALACSLLFALLGCAEVTVHRGENQALRDDSRLTESRDLSARTWQTLRQLNLEETYRHHPTEAVSQLRALTQTDPQPDRLFALAEVCFDLGRKAERSRRPDAVAYYFWSAGYAYRYLIPSDADSREKKLESSSFDPHFRLACDLYNASLTQCLRAAAKNGKLDPYQTISIATGNSSNFIGTFEHFDFPWQADEFGPMLFCTDYRVVGLENQHHSYGLGAPLICERRPAPIALVHASYPLELYFPGTAFLRFEGDPGELKARLELHNPLANQTVQVQGRSVPLETDLTTPLAYSLSRSDAYRLQYEGFLFADKVQKRTGIYLLEPYQPGKIPVLFVHGLLSSPATWAKMYNDLRADPVIRQHFQFWGYFYPTGDSYFQTAADLRGRLAGLRAELDPGHRDPALDEMVCVGHSMGGLISKLLTVDSGDSFWRLVSARPFDSLRLEPGIRDELQQLFFFQPAPSVRRVIFLATPHHGSSLSRAGFAQLADKLIDRPQALLRAGLELTRDNPGVKFLLADSKVPTSVDLLDPVSPCLEKLATLPPAPQVHYHSVIGVLPPDESWLNYVTPVSRHGKEKSDGIVAYSSAHLDGVDSELIVPADHMEVHQHPLSILEVRRILLEHLQR
jgi:pimeloyl-ACP methyl ester carboxylesterase